MSGSETPLLKAYGISKRYGHVQALAGVDIEIARAEVVALVGDNGAGKSTLIKTLSGVLRPDDGTIEMRGEPVRMHSPHQAVALGIATLYQDLALVDTRSVAANLFLGREFKRGPFVDRRRMNREARRALEELRADIPSVRAPVARLSGGQRQAVAIGRAVIQGGDLFIMDEPTAALGVVESGRVLELVEQLRDQGRAVLIVSHNLEHVWRIADRVVVLSRGRVVGSRRKHETTIDEVVRMIVYGAATTEGEAFERRLATDPP